MLCYFIILLFYGSLLLFAVNSFSLLPPLNGMKRVCFA